MVGIVKEINGQKKIIPLTTDTGTGAPVGTLIQQYKKKPISGYLYCDGSTFDQNAYPALYMYLGTNVLPDYRECVMVGAEQNTTDTIATHDVYGEGEFKDDQLQQHTHQYRAPNNNTDVATLVPGLRVCSASIGAETSTNSGRLGTTTHGKQKAVYVYIKATSGLMENQQDNVLNDVKDYVDNSNSYSTEEVKTGGTWIDGKPIYRKVVNFGALPNATSKNITFDNIYADTFVKVTVVAKSSSSGDAISIPYAAIGTTSDSINYVVSNNMIRINTGTNYSSFDECHFILEYTKTTD